MSNIVVADFPLRLIAGLNERAREANFETLASTIGEAAKRTIEKSGTASALKGWGRQ
jgi:hypothetical protein